MLLLALLLAAGAFRSMLALISIVAHVPADLGLGYGLGDGEAIALLLAVPNLGIVAGGVSAGWLSGRSGPGLPLLGGVITGAAATVTMLAGVSVLPLAVVCAGLLGMAAGAIGASGYNLAMDLAAPAQHGTVAGLVSVTLALGSVIVSVTGGEVLKSTQIPVGHNSSEHGVYLYIALAAACFALAAIPAAAVLRRGPTTVNSGRQL